MGGGPDGKKKKKTIGKKTCYNSSLGHIDYNNCLQWEEAEMK